MAWLDASAGDKGISYLSVTARCSKFSSVEAVCRITEYCAVPAISLEESRISYLLMLITTSGSDSVLLVGLYRLQAHFILNFHSVDPTVTYTVY